MASWDHDDLMDKSNRNFVRGSFDQRNEATFHSDGSMTPPKFPETEPMRVLQECIEVLRKKGNDYQNPNSRVKQAHYYEHGLVTLMDIIQAKRLRLVSLIEAFEANPSTKPNFESIEDSFKDMANYCAIAAAWCRGRIEGQDPNRDILNRVKVVDDIAMSRGHLPSSNTVPDANGAMRRAVGTLPQKLVF